MSNRLEYSFLLVSLVALLTVYVLYDSPKNIKEQHLPSTTTTDGNSPRSGSRQATPGERANLIPPSGPLNTQATFDRGQATSPGKANSTASSPPGAEIAVNEKAGGLNEMGLMYLNGKGVTRNLEAAFEFFNLAAQNGDFFAMANLARMYEKGWGTETSQGKALRWYAKAAELGNTLARDDWQRLRGLVSEPSETRHAETRITAKSTAGGARGSQSSSPENHKAISVTARDTVQPTAKVEASKTLISPETRWSIGAIPFASSDPAQVSDLKRLRTTVIEPQ